MLYVCFVQCSAAHPQNAIQPNRLQQVTRQSSGSRDLPAKDSYQSLSHDELVDIIISKDEAIKKRDSEYQRLNSRLESCQEEFDVSEFYCADLNRLILQTMYVVT